MPVVALTVVGGALRFWRLGHQSLWLDEVLTVLDSSPSLHQMLKGSLDPSIPPLYYFGIHFLLPLGRSEALLRLPSAILGTLSIPLFYQVVRHWSGHRTALIACGLLTCSPFHIWYSQEARPYALLIFLVLASLGFLHRVLDHPNHKFLPASFLICNAATFYAHPVALPFFGILGGYVLAVSPREQLPLWTRRALLVGVLLGPAVFWLATLPPGVSANRYFQFHPVHVGYVLWTFGTGYSLGPTMPELGLQGLGAVIRNVAVLGPTLALLLFLLAGGALHLWRVDRIRLWVLGIFLTFPILFAVLGAVLTEQSFNARYAIVAFPAYVTLIAIGLASIRKVPWRLAAGAGLGLISLVSLINYYDNPRYQREDTRAAVRFLNEVAQPGELVVSSAAYMAIPIQYYDRRKALTWVSYPRVGATLRERVGVRLVVPGRVARDLDALVGARQRVWVFLSRTFHSDPTGEIQRYFDTHFMREEVHTWAGVHVLLYQRRNGTTRSP